MRGKKLLKCFDVQNVRSIIRDAVLISMIKGQAEGRIERAAKPV